MEGFVTPGGIVTAAVHDNPDLPPPASADAPRGWTWGRKERRWKPRQRGPILFEEKPQEWLTTEASSRVEWLSDGSMNVINPDGSTEHFTAEQLAEMDAQQDSEPGWMADPGGAEADEPFVLDGQGKKDIKALVALAYTVPAEILPMRDEYCFGPLQTRKTADGVIDAVTDILCGSPRVARWAASKSGLMPWIKLGIALKPVGANMVRHHVTKSVLTERTDDGQQVVRQPDYSAFPAA